MGFKKDDIVISLLNDNNLKGKIGKILSIYIDQALIEFQDWNNGHDGLAGIKGKQDCWWIQFENIEHFNETDNKSIISLIIE